MIMALHMSRKYLRKLKTNLKNVFRKESREFWTQGKEQQEGPVKNNVFFISSE